MHTLRGAVLVLTALLVARASEGAPITFMFEGNITVVSPGNPTSVGDTFSGTFTYDPDAAPTRTDVGEAYFDDNVLGITFALGGWSASAAPPTIIGPPAAPLGLIYDHAFAQDVLWIQDVFDTSTTVMDFSLDGVFIAFGDSTRSAFSSPILPDTLDLSAFDLLQVSLGWEGPGRGFSDRGVITRVERADLVVPEPSMVVLAGAAGAAAVLRRRRQRR